MAHLSSILGLRTALNFILPHLCPVCQSCQHTAGFCASCWIKIHFLRPPYCELCGNPGILGSRNICGPCLADTPLFHRHRSLWEYGALTRRLIFALKHGHQRHLVELLATWITPLVLEKPVDFLIPVPLHQDRLAQRGFNQSAVLATALSRSTGIPVALQGLRRLFKTPSQGRFSAHQRRENVMGVFESLRSWDHQRILLIDDVFTTGATLNACAQTLSQAGAHRIYAITLAKVVHA